MGWSDWFGGGGDGKESSYKSGRDSSSSFKTEKITADKGSRNQHDHMGSKVTHDGRVKEFYVGSHASRGGKGKG